MSATTLAPIDYRRRPAVARAALEGRRALVSDPDNVRWLTGFGGSLGWVVIDDARIVLITDGRYADRAASELSSAGLDGVVDVEVRYTRPEVAEAVVAIAGSADRRDPVLAEDQHLTHAAWTALAADLDLEPAGTTLCALRRAKDAGELARIGHAATIADEALVEIAPHLADQPTEGDVRDELEYRMRRLGADGPSYATIVASGPHNAARPHHETGRRRIVEGDTVVIDVGALVDGYHSDMTRTLVVGDPTTEQVEIFDLVGAAQAAGLAAVRPGLSGVDLDAACREVFAAAGRAEWFTHGTGHGVGLQIHEAPYAARTSSDVLAIGDVVTVEPGLYRDGFGGVRIEDLVTVTATGCELLTHLPKDAPCLPSPPTT